MPSEGAQKRKFELSAAESSKSSASVERKGDTGWFMPMLQAKSGKKQQNLDMIID